VKTPERYIVVLKDCYVLPNAAIITAEGNIIEESCFPYQSASRVGGMFSPWLRYENSQFSASLDDLEIVDRPAIYIREHGEMGFFHWMHSVFPRVDVFSGSRFHKDFQLYCSSHARFQREALALCGIDASSIISPRRDKVQFFRELLFPSPLVQGGDFWLRPLSVGRFYDGLRVPTPSGPRRIYVTRRDAQIRRLLNEDALLTVLSRLDFEPIELSSLTFSEQIGLFRSCEFVAGVHGAGLSHIVGLSPTAGVLEILHPRRFWGTYRAISARRGVRYGFAIGEDLDAGLPGDSFDFRIDVGKVLGVLRQMNLH
jgi:capsular polysaccharide biosynthesis protein